MNPLELRAQYEKQRKDLLEACGEALLELRAREKLAAWIAVPLAKLCI